MRLFVSALEYSANIHLKYLLRELVKCENIELCGIFDSKIIDEIICDSRESSKNSNSCNALHGKPICNINEVAVMGFIDVLKRARFFLTLRAKCLNVALKADKILLMDSSSFNIPLAKKIKARDCQKEIMYYILPQVWAWKPWRARVIEANCDKLCAILPFEVSCYATKARFVGHPLLDEIKYFRELTHPLTPSAREGESISSLRDLRSESKQSKTRESKSQNESMIDKRINKSDSPLQKNDSNNLTPCDLDSSLNSRFAQNDGFESNIITFMPGSRPAEINRIFPIFLQVKDALKAQDSATKFILVIPRKFNGKNLVKIYGDLSDFEISFDSHSSLLKSKFAFICSGTATLECALIGTPFVLGYLGRWIEAFVVKQFLHIRFVGLANILYNHIKNGENFHDELLQENLSAKNLLDSYHRANPSEFLTKSKILRKYLKSGSAKAVAKWLLQG